MKKAYEEKITGEIRRTLRNLEEACAEQQITMEQALEWYRASRLRTENVSSESVSIIEPSYREKVEQFVSKYVEGEDKEICVVTLCYMKEQEKCPNVKQILDEVKSKIKITYTNQYHLEHKVRRALTLMLGSYRGRSGDGGTKMWTQLKMPLFNLSKSL